MPADQSIGKTVMTAVRPLYCCCCMAFAMSRCVIRRCHSVFRLSCDPAKKSFAVLTFRHAPQIHID